MSRVTFKEVGRGTAYRSTTCSICMPANSATRPPRASMAPRSHPTRLMSSALPTPLGESVSLRTDQGAAGRTRPRIVSMTLPTRAAGMITAALLMSLRTYERSHISLVEIRSRLNDLLGTQAHARARPAPSSGWARVRASSSGFPSAAPSAPQCNP